MSCRESHVSHILQIVVFKLSELHKSYFCCDFPLIVFGEGTDQVNGQIGELEPRFQHVCARVFSFINRAHVPSFNMMLLA